MDFMLVSNEWIITIVTELMCQLCHVCNLLTVNIFSKFTFHFQDTVERDSSEGLVLLFLVIFALNHHHYNRVQIIQSQGGHTLKMIKLCC